MVVLFVILGIIAVLLIALIIFVFSTYNGLVAARNRVRNQKSQIDIQLKKRFDLIPNLVETVKGYANHEKNALEAVIKARNTYVTAGNDTAAALEAGNTLTGALNKLFALSEAYPDLKANTNFLSLQSDLKQTEQQIAYSRQFYNDSVNILNNKIEMFPSSIIAGMFGFKEEAFFEAQESDKENVKVEF